MATGNETPAGPSKIPGLTYLVPELNGSDHNECITFFEKFDAICQLGDWNDAERIAILKSRLRGNANKFFITSHELRQEKSYTEFKKKILDYFTTKPSITSQQLLFSSAKQAVGESVKELANRITNLTLTYVGEEKLNDASQQIINKIRLSKFIEALDIEYKRQVMLANPTDFNQAVEIAMNCEQAMFATQPISQVNDFVPGKNIHDNNQLNILQKQQEQFNTNLISLLAEQMNAIKLAPKNEDKMQSNQQVEKTNLTCVFCGKKNHLMIDCRAYAREKTINRHSAPPVPFSYPNLDHSEPPAYAYQQEPKNQHSHYYSQANYPPQQFHHFQNTHYAGTPRNYVDQGQYAVPPYLDKPPSQGYHSYEDCRERPALQRENFHQDRFVNKQGYRGRTFTRGARQYQTQNVHNKFSSRLND